MFKAALRSTIFWANHDMTLSLILSIINEANLARSKIFKWLLVLWNWLRNSCRIFLSYALLLYPAYMKYNMSAKHPLLLTYTFYCEFQYCTKKRKHSFSTFSIAILYTIHIRTLPSFCYYWQFSLFSSFSWTCVSHFNVSLSLSRIPCTQIQICPIYIS